MIPIKITIPGKPIAKKRPRFARRGKFVAVINDQQTEEGRFLFEVQKQFNGQPADCALTLHVIFEIPRPKSHYGTGKNSTVLKPSAPVHHTQKPDLDNLVKFLKDCLNGVVYRDDCLVTQEIAVKRWADKGETRILIGEF